MRNQSPRSMIIGIRWLLTLFLCWIVIDSAEILVKLFSDIYNRMYGDLILTWFDFHKEDDF